MPSTLDRIDPIALGQQLRSARLIAGLTQAQAAEKMGMSRTTLVSIEKGSRPVTSGELPRFAKIYNGQVSNWLGAKTSAEPLIPQFRSLAGEDAFAPELRKCISQLEELARDYKELEELTGSPLIQSFPDPYQHRISGVSAELRGEEIAAAERLRLSLGKNPVRDLRSLLEEEVGLRIFYLNLPSAVSGIYAYTDELGGCIAINRLHPNTRSSWSLAHEYGHFMSTRSAADVAYSQGRKWGKVYDEKFADSFAKNFLMPRDGINSSLSSLIAAEGGNITIAHVLSLSHKFNISAQAMFKRLEELRRLPNGTWDKLVDQNFKPETAKATLGIANKSQREPMLPFRYRLLAQRAYDISESELTESNLAHYLRTDLASTRDELDQIRALIDRADDDGFLPISVNVTDLLQKA